MIDILKDDCPQMVIPKASKVGVSELLFIKMMTWAIHKKSGMYVLPTDPVRTRLVSTRIDPLVGATPLYRNNCGNSRKSADNKTLKTLFNSHWNFVGSRSPENFYEFDADVLIFDEFDRCDQANLLVAMDRLGSAAAEVWCKIGNPSMADFGIDHEYKLSDMRQWFIPCPSCGTKQVLEWQTHFVRQDDAGKWQLIDSSSSPSSCPGGHVDANPICAHCNKPMDRLAGGEWVPTYPDRDIHGYHADRLFGAPGNDFDDERPIIRETFAYWLAAQGNPTDMQTFYNNRLGVPFEAEGAKLTMAMLAKCASDYLMPANATDTVAGVDVGKLLHVHISKIEHGRIRQKVYIGTARDWNELQVLCHRYGVTRGVVDAMPEIHAAEEWCRDHAGWYRCYYSKPDNAKVPIDRDDVARTLNVKRTASCDNAYQEVEQGYLTLPKNWATLDGGDFAKQMLAPTRIWVEDKAKFIWDEGNQADHHFHANVYEGLAASMIATGSLIQ